MHADKTEVNRLSERIIGCAFQVLNTLGAGSLEKLYENAPAHELRKSGLIVVQQQGVTVTYDGIIVGEYNVDLLVEETIMVELKATGLHLNLLLNFGRSHLEIQRIAHNL